MKKRWIYFSILLCISLLVRISFLSSPEEVIFDEVHWGKFVNAYASSGQNLFDVHPPHGKLLVVGLLKLVGYDGLQNFEKIGTPLTHISGITLRIIPALCGALVPVILFLILLATEVSIEMAFLFSLCSALDNALILQSRVMGLYPMLLLALVSSFYFALKVKEDSSNMAALLFCGIACGLAAGFQFTGITALALAFVILGWKAYKQLGMITAVAVAVYMIGWKIHFVLLPHSGFGDAFYKNTGDFFADLIELHHKMYNASATLTTTHPDASSPWSWPLMTKPIFYWAGPGRSLYFIGNPVVWWGISLLLIWNAVQQLINFKTFKDSAHAQSLFAFLLSYVPLTLMKRVLFLYHYLTPLTYATLYVGQTTPRWSYRKYYSTIALLVLGFILLSPVTYGWRMPSWYWAILPWKLVH